VGASTLTVIDSTFSHNGAGEGGAIYSRGNTLTVIGSTFSDNNANLSGGGAIATVGEGQVSNSTLYSKVASNG
jgi:predicted outer membrane repeat protein